MYIYTIINRWIYLEGMEEIDVIDDMEEMEVFSFCGEITSLRS
jgi:hypothetical protein